MVVDLEWSVDRLSVVVPGRGHEPPAGCKYPRDFPEGHSFVRCKEKGVNAQHAACGAGVGGLTAGAVKQ